MQEFALIDYNHDYANHVSYEVPGSIVRVI